MDNSDDDKDDGFAKAGGDALNLDDDGFNQNDSEDVSNEEGDDDGMDQ